MTTTTAATSPAATTTTWKIKLLYDGDCPLCLREVNFLRAKDNGRGLVAFTNIADANYSPGDNGGVDFATTMGRIHAVRPDGTVVKNVAVFRQVYSALGIGWIYAPTGWPIIGALVDWVYGIWADWRLAVTGRPSLKTILAEREAQRQAGGHDGCSHTEGSRCRV